MSLAGQWQSACNHALVVYILTYFPHRFKVIVGLTICTVVDSYDSVKCSVVSEVPFHYLYVCSID